MAGEKPTAAMVLSVIGGLFILFGGLALIAIAEFLQSLLLFTGESVGIEAVLFVQLIGVIGIVIGIVIIAGGVLMYARPASSTAWGVIILVISLVSIIASGGFIIGLILGLIGGILGIVFKPTAPMAPVTMPPPAAPAPEPEEPSTESGEQ